RAVARNVSHHEAEVPGVHDHEIIKVAAHVVTGAVAGRDCKARQHRRVRQHGRLHAARAVKFLIRVGHDKSSLQGVQPLRDAHAYHLMAPNISSMEISPWALASSSAVWGGRVA